MTVKKDKLTMPMMKKALVRAVDEHGHKWGCSARMGMERDCHCGWLEVREIVKRITVPRSGS